MCKQLQQLRSAPAHCSTATLQRNVAQCSVSTCRQQYIGLHANRLASTQLDLLLGVGACCVPGRRGGFGLVMAYSAVMTFLNIKMPGYMRY